MKNSWTIGKYVCIDPSDRLVELFVCVIIIVVTIDVGPAAIVVVPLELLNKRLRVFLVRCRARNSSTFSHTNRIQGPVCTKMIRNP
ncbi:hypothetical protein BLA29_003239 [Euroglyphus maynei]|uniref:Uncharacterized protein n=1 Tax=Euroglyphus maynei TaxID=6958 RepID=A0A1Y3AUG4_EURMA|nr:hypothetical protein BLA29_003239 [Euroglyphus maynei]